MIRAWFSPKAERDLDLICDYVSGEEVKKNP